MRWIHSLQLPDKSHADGWDDAAYYAATVKKLNDSEELKKLNLLLKNQRKIWITKILLLIFLRDWVCSVDDIF